MMKSKGILRLALVLAFGGPLVCGAGPVSTSFTYQGRLNQNGVAVNGQRNFKVTLYPDAGGLAPVPNTPVITRSCVQVANGLFTLTLNFGDASAYNCQDRWIEIEVAPCGSSSYQTMAPRVELLPTPFAIQSLSACSVAADGVSAASILNSTITANKIAPGQVVKSLKGLRDDVNLVGTGGVSVNVNGNSLEISAPPGANIWSRNGSSAYYNGGNVGIGTMTPEASLYVHSMRSTAMDNTATFFNPSLGPEASHIHYGQTGDWYIRSAINGGKVVLQDHGGKVSIGPGLSGSAPSSTLVTSAGGLPLTLGAESALASFGLTTGNATSLGVRARRTSAGDGWQRVALGLTFDVDNTVQAGAGIWLGANGNVGIGTTDPTSKLHVAMPGGATPVSAMQLQVGTFGTPGNVLASTFLTAHDVGSGQLQFAIRGDGHAYAGGGIGLPGNFGPDNNFVGAPGNYIAFGHPGVSEDFIGYRDNTFFFKDSPGGGDTCDPTVEVAVLRITGGCDLAEPFQMSHTDIPEGAVVIIDEENPGQLKMSASAYDRRVAGIVSGANGIKAGITLHQEGLIEGGQNVALSGRVYVQADASERPIKPGDLLTTSDTPGHAMTVADHAKAQGAVLGKAMTGLNEGKGMVLILVTLQ